MTTSLLIAMFLFRYTKRILPVLPLSLHASAHASCSWFWITAEHILYFRFQQWCCCKTSQWQTKWYVWYYTWWVQVELILNYYLSDIFGHWFGWRIHPLWPDQDFTTPWDYLIGLSPAHQVLSFQQRQLQLQCHYKPKLTQWFKVHHVEIGVISTE